MTFKEFTKSSQINESWLYTLMQVVDPTGVLSYPDLIRATQKAAVDPSAINLSLWALAAFAAMPNLGLLATGVGGVPWAAAKAAARGAAKNPKLLEKAGLQVVKLLKKEPGKSALERLVNKMVGEKVITDIQAKALLGTIQKGSSFRLTKTDIGTLAKGAKGAGTYVPTKPVIAAAGTNVAGNVGKAAAAAAGKQATFQKGTRLKTAARVLPGIVGGAQQGMADINKSIQSQAPAGAVGDTSEPVIINLPDGRQVQTTRTAAQQAGILPIEQPQPVSYNLGNQPLTPAQAAALGPFAVPKTATAPGQLIPQNIPQGATPQQPFGREGMTPQQYMRPDNFNNPPTSFFGPGFNQPGYYGQPQYGGIAGGVAGLGNIFGGLLQNVGGLAGQMAGTPVAGIGNMAGSLLGILPGLGGSMMGGSMPGIGMFPGMGGI